MPGSSNLFSIIIPTYNRSALLQEAVNGILAQSYKNFELIIVDDSSASGHQEFIDALVLVDDRIRLIRNDENLGVSSSRNKGLEEALGDFVIFLDDDDCLTEKVLEAVNKSFTENSGVHVVIYPSEVHPASNKQLFQYHATKETLRRQPYKKLYHEDLQLMVQYPPQSNSMAFRKAIFAHCQFDPSMSFGEDIYLWFSLIKQNIVFSEKLDPDQEAKALVRIHGEHHLSQTMHVDVISFLKKVKQEWAMEDPRLGAILEVKIFMRYIMKKEIRKAILTLGIGLKKAPLLFFLFIAHQLRLKSKIMLSYWLYRCCKLEIGKRAGHMRNVVASDLTGKWR